MLNRRGWDSVPAGLVAQPGRPSALVATHLLGQGFIRRRSRVRWLAHQLVFWGCILAALVTFPLTLGLLHFESVGQDADRYQVYISRVGTLQFDADSVAGWFTYHALDVAAVLVLGGVFVFLRRRLRDPGALATERSGDFLALAGLFAVSVTGLFLTVSSTWLDGQFYAALNTLHALTVILGLMYIPFGKLFHIFQRPGNLGVAYYKRVNADGPPAVCRRCGEGFASAQQIADLKAVLPQVGFDYDTVDGVGSFQDTCPRLSAGAGDAGPVRPGRRVRLMARLPVTEEELVARFGPHLNEAPPGGWDHELRVDRVVETHCCFCGQQCGIKLKVRDNAVVGFEPWYEFPFNEGKLCPKGVKRYLQGSHPDRLLSPMERDPAAPGGFRPIGWDVALDRVVGEIRRIQAAYGDDAFAMLSGVSLTNEKSYLIGKFARLALHTANLDYNGRFCMVSAGAGNKKALGVDRNANPWSDIPLADVVWVAGSNVAETFPITTSYIWRARDRGARLIVQDPRVVPLARTADLYLPVRPGTDSALFDAVLHVLIDARLAGSRVHRRTHQRLRPGGRRRRRDDPGVGGDGHRCARGTHRAGGRVVGHGGHRDAPARPRHRAAHQGHGERARRDQPRPGDRQVRQAGLRGDDDHRSGQRAGRA